MEQNFQHDEKIESQIRECFGRVAYTHKAHEKCADFLAVKGGVIKTIQIVLSAITTGGFLYTIFGDNKFITVFGVVASTVLLILTLYYKEFKFEELAEKHRIAALSLWNVRESYVSLLVDMRNLDKESMVNRRDDLQNQLFRIYEHSPRTNSKGYSKAQQSLKYAEDLTFSNEEIDIMLPEEIRKNKRSRG